MPASANEDIVYPQSVSFGDRQAPMRCSARRDRRPWPVRAGQRPGAGRYVSQILCHMAGKAMFAFLLLGTLR